MKNREKFREDILSWAKNSKGNAENLIQELESGNIYLEDLGKDTVDRLISLLKSKEG